MALSQALLQDIEQLLAVLPPDFAKIADLVLAEMPEDDRFDHLLLGGLALLRQDRIADAHAFLEECAVINPASHEAQELLACCECLLGRFNDAAFALKQASNLPLSSQPWIVSLIHPHLPNAASLFPNIQEDNLLKLGFRRLELGLVEQAEQNFRDHLAFHPDSLAAHIGIVQCLIVIQQPIAAQHAVRAALHHFPQEAALYELLATLKYETGDIQSAETLYQYAVTLDDSPRRIARLLVDRLYLPDIQPAQLESVMGLWSEAARRKVRPQRQVLRPKRSKDDPIHIGYIVAGHGASGEDAAIASLLAAHTPKRFRLTGYGYGALSDDRNALFQHVFTDWRDVSASNPATLSRIIQGDGIDVLVHLTGFAVPDLMELFATRQTPVQIIARGCPAPLHFDSIDAILLNQTLAAHYPGDRVVRTLSQVWDFADLPEDTPPVANAAAANLRTIALPGTMRDLTPQTVQLACHILNSIPDTTLLLRDHAFRESPNLEHILYLFGDYGCAHRIDVISCQSDYDLLEQSSLVILPTGPRGPQLAIDALSLGRPVICLKRPSPYHNRTADFLLACGLADDCVVDSLSAAASLATTWIENPERRAAFAGSIQERLKAASPFDVKSRCRELEDLYVELLDKALLEKDAAI